MSHVVLFLVCLLFYIYIYIYIYFGLQSCEVSRCRVCYQRFLLRLVYSLNILMIATEFQMKAKTPTPIDTLPLSQSLPEVFL